MSTVENLHGAATLTGAVDGEGRSWVEVMPVMTEARNGRQFYTITRDDLDRCVASIEEGADRIHVDYDHEGATGGSTRAAGWFTGQAKVIEAGETNPDGDVALHASVWAEVEWTPAAQTSIRDGEFRFISPEWDMADKDPKTGLWTRFQELVAATLTNRPFFDHMAAVTARLEITSPEGGFFRLATEISEVLNRGTDPWHYYVCDIDEQNALVCEGDETYWSIPYSVADDGSVTVSPSTDWTALEKQFVTVPREAMVAMARLMQANGGSAAPTQGDRTMGELISKMRGVLGLGEAATDDEVLTASLERLKATEDDEKDDKTDDDAPEAEGDDDEKDDDEEPGTQTAAVAIDPDTYQRLLADAKAGREADKKVERLLARQQAEERDTLLASAIEDGKFAPARREHYAKAFDADPAGTKALIASLAAGLVPVAERGVNTAATEQPFEWFPQFETPKAAAAAKER